jgi:hypothetical protein
LRNFTSEESWLALLGGSLFLVLLIRAFRLTSFSGPANLKGFVSAR